MNLSSVKPGKASVVCWLATLLIVFDTPPADPNAGLQLVAWYAQVEIEVKALESGASPDVTGQVSEASHLLAPLPGDLLAPEPQKHLS